MASATAASARLSPRVKVLYGLGLAAEGVKTNAFNMFLLFYYQQVAGLDPVLTGLALFVALCVDAITDPMVGVWSDGLRSKLGRRHPFMYAASVPLALCFVAVFHPPSTSSQALLFAWLATFAIGTRFAMTLFTIPHQSLVAELSDSYDERTRLQSARTAFAWLFGLCNVLLAYTFFLRATPESPYDPAGFSGFAIFGAVVMLVTTLTSSLGTQRAAVHAQSLVGIRFVPMNQLFREIRVAFGSRNYRTVVAAGLLGAVAFGLSENMGNYMNLFFWGFAAQELAVFIVVIAAASIVVMIAAPKLAGRFGKGRVAVGAALLSSSVNPLMVLLRLLDVLPPSGDPALLRILCVAVFFGYSGIITGFVMVGAMIADVTDEHQLRVGSRQEGLLFSAGTLVAKAASGLAPLLAGVVIKLAGFPDQARLGQVDPETVRRLGIFVALFGLALGLLAAMAYARYRLTRQEHASILDALHTRAAKAPLANLTE
jgi:GPH family glycoside/pentoside/hexuronide:cation symporter